MDIEDVAACFRYYADQILEFEQKSMRTEVDVGSSFHAYVTYEPIGVSALIIPWNYPLLMAAWKIAPCLAAGCTCVLKPSELTPLTAFELAHVMDSVGLPEGVFNLIQGIGPDAGVPLSNHPDVVKVAFTGSVPTGSKIAAAGAATIKKVSLELGGKSPLVVCGDADVQQAVDWISVGIFFNQGQVCSATSRVLVHKSLSETLVDRLVSRAEGITVGAGDEQGVKMGPLVSKGQYEKVLNYIKTGIEQGAKVVAGGGRPTHVKGSHEDGYYVAPTVFVDVKPEMTIWREEIFGPVLSIMTFEDEEEALRLANDTPYGLAGAVFSTDKEKCLKFSRELQCGIVWINCSQPTFVQLPWGGFKQSGTGRELGPWGLMNYLEAKQVSSWIDSETKGWDWFGGNYQ
eukprot:TRINITY_DN4519_c0_g2_i12.p1 TRINITY_DN4519_c0_g2~~TRINITY_DN4519_c0_g2_i12.p1  ORF type:complete len:401 (+),score=106.11 TRINITY_DN4519_c0_g2_i12:918-2120(+)